MGADTQDADLHAKLGFDELDKFLGIYWQVFKVAHGVDIFFPSIEC